MNTYLRLLKATPKMAFTWSYLQAKITNLKSLIVEGEVSNPILNPLLQ